MAKTKSSSKKPEFNKYFYYEESVQSPETDVEFFANTYKKIRGKEARIFREDFCGTHMISCEWVKLHKDNIAHGIDLDLEPIQYGVENHETKLTEEQKSRLHIHHANVMDPNLPKGDIVSASNFSYFLFKKREDLKKYFINAYEALNEGGIFIADSFGGAKCMEPNEEETEHDGYSYFWDQDKYNPITNEALFHIHFKLKGEKKREKCFTYDWRMWSLAEVQDILAEVGFQNTSIYWEESDEDGDGNGIFKPTKEGDDAEAWIAYIVAEK